MACHITSIFTVLHPANIKIQRTGAEMRYECLVILPPLILGVKLASIDPDLIHYDSPLCAYDIRKMSNELPPSWEKIKTIGNIVAALAIPILLAIVANLFSQRQKEMEIGIRYVELATQILRAEPSPDTKALRAWAVSIIENYSPVPLSTEASKNLEFERLKTEMQNYSSRLQSYSNDLDAAHRAAIGIVNAIQR